MVFVVVLKKAPCTDFLRKGLFPRLLEALIFFRRKDMDRIIIGSSTLNIVVVVIVMEEDDRRIG